MALEQRIDGSLVTNRVRLAGSSTGGVAGWPSSAWYGEPMTAGLTVDDPLGELDLRGWHVYTADETSAAKPRIFTGWLQGMRIGRGPYRTGPGRVWDCDIVDQNALFGFEVFRAASAKRPAETDVERITWAIASAPMAGTPIGDFGRFSTAAPVNFGESDYVTQYPIELFTSVAGISGKNFYAYWDDTEEAIGLHYDLTTGNPLASLRVSNVMAEVDGVTTFYPYVDAEMERDPTQVATGMLYGWQGGWVYDRNDDTIDGLSPTDLSPVNFLRDTVYRTDRVGHLATAQSQVTNQLVALASEQESIVCTVRLPAAVVNELHAGTAVEVYFSHLPGYDDPEYVEVAVIRRTVVPSPGRRDSYDVTLELSNNGQTARGPGGGDPAEAPYPEPSEHWWSGTGVAPSIGTWYQIGGDAPPFVPGTYQYSVSVTEHNNAYASRLRVATAGGDGFLLTGSDWSGLSGTFTIPDTGDPISDNSGGLNATGSGHDFGSGDPDIPTGGFAKTYQMQGGGAGNTTSSHEFTFTIDLVTDEDGDVVPPLAGQPVGPEMPAPAPNGTQETFQLLHPYVAGTLRVFVDNLDQTAAVVDFDPAAAEFTLAFAPITGEMITCWYRAR